MSQIPDDENIASTSGEAVGNAWVDDPQSDQLESLTGADRRHAADVAWLHSLLDQALRPDAAAREIRVQRVAAAIRDEVQPAAETARPRRRRWLATLTTIAAVFLIGIALRSNFNPQTTATAAVDNALKAAEQAVDRLYLVESQVQLSDGSTKTFTADLWVRGGTHYVLKQKTALGDVVLGSDGQDHWLVPLLGPVRTGPSPTLVEQWMLRDQNSMPFLQVTTLLQRMADRYDLKLGDAKAIKPSLDAAAVWCTQVIGTKRDAHDLLAPDVIRLWTARQSGIAHLVELDWNAVTDQPSLKHISCASQSLTAPLPENWYQHDAHHDASRRVIQRGPAIDQPGDGDANELRP